MMQVLFQPRLSLNQLPRNLIWHPAIALTEQSDEVRAAPLILLQADAHRLLVERRFFAHTPAQVDRLKSAGMPRT